MSLLSVSCGEQEKEIIVQSIAISQPSAEMRVGETLTLTASVAPSNAFYNGLTWTSTMPKVASVSQTGVVTAISEGNATITVMAGGKTASCSIKVLKSDIAVTSISLDKTSLEMAVGETATLTATVSPADATDKTVTWTSSNTAVATIDRNGQVAAIKEGVTTINAHAGDKSAACTVTVTNNVIAVTSITLNKTSLSLIIGSSETLVAMVQPDNATDKTVTWSSSNSSVATVDRNGKVTAVKEGTATITAKAGDKSAKSVVTVLKSSSNAEAVDLGLSVKWASCNVGASKPEEYGDYFAWGETGPKHNYDWSTYIWCNGSNTTLTKYNNTSSYGTVVDNKTVLEPDDDAAHVALGGKWRMPTDEEWKELRYQCTWVWTSNYNGTGVAGRIVTATNGNSIFLPAAGYLDNTSHYIAGYGGYYWSSSLLTFTPYRAWHVYFGSKSVYRDSYSRYGGQSVRPVSE